MLEMRRNEKRGVHVELLSLAVERGSIKQLQLPYGSCTKALH